MKFEKTQVFNFGGAFRGMRNPLESWARSDSDFSDPVSPVIGENDLTLAKALIKGGSEHRKFLRQIFVSVDITAPLYWFKEFDTYHVGVVLNSTSTMHCLSKKPITIDCFETDDYSPLICDETEPTPYLNVTAVFEEIENSLIPFLENLRLKYIKTKNKRYWKELIRWLPESFLQTRTITMNYENIGNMVRQRKNHKLNEWSGKDYQELNNFISWARTLPYAKELIFNEEEE